MRVFSDCRGASRFKTVTWKFKWKIFTATSCRKTCRTSLGAEGMCTECSLARSALCTRMKTSSLLPATEKKRKKPIHNSFSPHFQLWTAATHHAGSSSSQAISHPSTVASPLKSWNCTLERTPPWRPATASGNSREIHTRQEWRVSPKQILPLVFFCKLGSLGLLHICIGGGCHRKSITADCTDFGPSDHTDTHRQGKLLRTKITSWNKALWNQTLQSSDTTVSC